MERTANLWDPQSTSKALHTTTLRLLQPDPSAPSLMTAAQYLHHKTSLGNDHNKTLIHRSFLRRYQVSQRTLELRLPAGRLSKMTCASHPSHQRVALQPPQPQQTGLPSMSRTPPPRSSPGGDGRSDPMSLGNIMERRPDTEIDRSMLGRLDRKGQ